MMDLPTFHANKDFRAHEYERVTEAQYRARARSIIGTGDWSAAMDHTLAFALLGGKGLMTAAALLVVTPQQARDRWFAIHRAMTHREVLPLDARAILLDELRAAVSRIA